MNFLNNKPGGIPLGFVVASTLTLFGCGGEGSEGSAGSSASVSPNTQSATLSAQNATYSTGYAESFEVDLSSKVFSSTGGGFALSEVEVLSNDDSCQVESMTETGFVIQAFDTKVCDYRYHVTPKTLSPMSRMAEAPMSDSSSSEGSSSAVTRIAVSSNPSSTELVPVSATTLINEDVSVLLKDELEKVGFTLGNEFVLTELTLPYGRSSSAQINSTDDQTIDYTPPSGFTGIDRVLYTLEDSANGLVLMGVLDIAVGYEANQGFTINDNIVYPEIVEVFTEEEIDISDFVISDDGDDFQLVYVETFNADASPKDPLDTGNKTIVFQASHPGYHYISFAVSDHNGAYDMGLIRVEVVDPDQFAKWDDIPYLADVYIAPLTAVGAVTQGVAYDAKLVDTGYSPAMDMAGLRYLNAVAYCESIGTSLPTVTQLTQMTTDIQVQSLHNWPAQNAYLAYDEVADEPKWVDLSDDASAQTGAINPTGYYYSTCIKQGFIEVLASSSTQVVANGVDVGSVFVEVKLGQELRPDVIVSASVSSPNVSLESDTVTTDSNGIAEFRLTSFKAETVTLTFDTYGFTQNYNVKFIGDEKTAAVSSETTIDRVEYSSVEGGEVTVTLIDQNDNPVEGYSVSSTANSQTHPDTGAGVTPILIQESTVTDESGEQKVRVKWDTNYQTPKTSMTFDVTSSYTTTTNTQTDALSQVTFIGYVCGGQVGDDDQQNAAGACVKIAENDGKLFTGTPSVSFVNAVGYSDYSSTGVEDGSLGPSGTFARFNNPAANNLCEHYNTLELYERDDWALADRYELESLFNNFGSMFLAKGWAAGNGYWSSTASGSDYYNVSLDSVSVYSLSPAHQLYVSCVSG
ncbi:Ig-like domain-containing protein [Vibrio coralliirubri]|uniref:Ig-like domain-containing protein n=1 Tax=Vibrio coralliirubri TaxID=1516159 RepID=UPI000B359929|nr:hypothetical protein [Vibrio coralliirubri]